MFSCLKGQREQLQSQQQQLRSQIMQLETNPTNPNNKAELKAKKQQLKDLENKPARTQVEEMLLTSKKRQLAELLKKQNDSTNSSAGSKDKNDKTVLYIGLGMGVMFLVLGIFILAKIRKRKK